MMPLHRVAAFASLVCLLFAVPAFATPIQWPKAAGGNGHWYDVCEAWVCDWNYARDYAATCNRAGTHGYLATVTSSDENAFIHALLAGRPSAWLGGYQSPQTSEPNQNWRWVTDEPWNYINWCPGLPDDQDGPYSEHCLQYSTTEACWNDEDQITRTSAFVVEYPNVEPPSGFWLSGIGVPGLNGSGATALCAYDNTLAVGGGFTQAGGVSSRGIACWDGQSWHGLAGGVTGEVLALAVYQGALIVAGQFTQAGGVTVRNIAQWDGQEWTSLGTGINYIVYSLQVYDDKLVAGGYFTEVDGQQIQNIAQWDGESWAPLAGGVSGQVSAMTVYDDDLIVGGQFGSAGGFQVGQIAQWNGATWSSLGGGMNEKVSCLTIWNGLLVAAGEFATAGTVYAPHIAAWDGVGWSALGDDFWFGSSARYIPSMASYQGALYLTVNTDWLGNTEYNHLARWDGSQLTPLGPGTDHQPWILYAFAGRLVVGGPFTYAGDESAGHIAEWAEPWSFRVEDVAPDEGGWVRVSWLYPHSDLIPVGSSVDHYEVQVSRIDGWSTLSTVVPGSPGDSLSVVVLNDAIAIVGQTVQPCEYRVVAYCAPVESTITSGVQNATSTDDLPPPAPVIELHDGETWRALIWQNPGVPDFKETCVYLGTSPGFSAGAPESCTDGIYYGEDHLAMYYYRARSYDIHGNASEWSNEVVGRYPTNVPGAPTVLRLYPNQPNPFNPMTTLRFDVPVGGRVRLEVYDVAGRLVRALLDAEVPAGSRQAVWDGRDEAGRAMASGSYFARLSAGGRMETVRMGIIR